MNVSYVSEVLSGVISNSGMVDHSGRSGDFQNMLQDKLNKIDSEIKSSEAIIADYVLGKNVSTHDLLMSINKAKSSLDTAIAVRNKMIEAYREIIRMQI